MHIEDYFDFFDDGDIRIKGHRIGLEDVLYEYIHKDLTPEELVRRFPTLTLEQIHATILYYLHNKEEVIKYMNDWIEHGNKMRALQEKNPTPDIIRLRKIAAQTDAIKKARGILRNKRFSTENYFKIKSEDKVLE